MVTLLLGVWLAFAPQNTTILQGTVKRGGASDPIAGVEITLSGGSAQGARYRTTSDAQGRFTFENLPLGRYTIQANREGYFAWPGGQALPFPVAFLEIDSLQTQRITIDLAPGATVSGRITDPQGNPLTGVKVSAATLQYDSGRRVFSAGSVPKVTDIRGDYRIFWLPPGEYYIRAEYPDGTSNLARRSYYPGTLDSPFAALLTIRGGEVLDNINFALPKANNIKISGQVSLLNNAPYPSSGFVRTFYLLPRDGRPVEQYPAEFLNTVRQRPGVIILDFAIEVRGIAPGSYDLAPFYLDGNSFFTGRTRIDIGDRDLENVTANVGPNIEVTGHVSLKDKLEYDQWRSIQIQLRSRDVPVPLTARSGSATFQRDGTFSIRDVVEGRYQLYLGARPGSIPSDLYISAIRQGGNDLQDEGTIEVRPGMQPLDITLSTGAGKIEGSVESAIGGIPARADVVLVPALQRRNNIMYYDRATIDSKGRFTFSGIAPGEYRVFAFEQLADGAEQNPQFIARYETLGQSVTVSSSTTKEMRLRLLR
jgi:hypothetical protein